MCDKIIDKNGPKPKGTGIKQLRENIAESKLSYEIMDDAAQVWILFLSIQDQSCSILFVFRLSSRPKSWTTSRSTSI